MKKLFLFLVIILILSIVYAQSGNVTKPSAVSEPDIILHGLNIQSLKPDIIFDVTNSDPNHKLEGYLSCPIPNDMAISQVEGAEYLKGFITTSRFVLDTAPHSRSIDFKIERQNDCLVFLNCSLNYALFKEDKGYVRDVISRDGVTYVYRYNPTPTYLQKEESIQLGKECTPPCSDDDMFCKLKKWFSDLIHSKYFVLRLGLFLLVLILLRELKKYTFKTKKGHVYFRIKKNSVPGWILDKVKQEVKSHYPFTLKQKVFYNKDKQYRYVITRDFLGVYRYYRRKREGVNLEKHGPVKEIVFEFLIWWLTFSVGVWLAAKIIPFVDINHKFIILFLIGVIIETIARIMQVFRYNVSFFKNKSLRLFIIWSLIHATSYFVLLYILDKFLITNILLKIIFIGLGITFFGRIIWKLNLDSRRETWNIAIVILAAILLYLTKELPGFIIFIKNALVSIKQFFISRKV